MAEFDWDAGQCECSPPPNTDGPLPWCPIHGDPEVYRVGKADGRAEVRAAVQALHRRETHYVVDDGEQKYVYPTRDDAAEYVADCELEDSDIEPYDVCAYCSSLETADFDEESIVREGKWPCPTIAALDNPGSALGAVQREEYDTGVLQDDVRELLNALGLSDHARPYSPHEVIQREILPTLDAVKREAWDAGCSRAMRKMSDEPDLSLVNPYGSKEDGDA